jgi:hypothetical protein
MQAADFGNLHDPVHLRPLDRPPVGRIFLEREVSPSAVIVREVACHFTDLYARQALPEDMAVNRVAIAEE